MFIANIDDISVPRLQIPWVDDLWTPDTAVTVTASGTVNTKGLWSALSASCPFDAAGFYLISDTTGQSATNTGQLCDIGFGAPSSEAVVIPDVQTGYSALLASTSQPARYFPLAVPSGTRVSARIQAAIASDTVDLTIGFVEKNHSFMYPSFQYAENIGAVSASSILTIISGGGWQEIAASTSRDIRAVAPIHHCATLGGNEAEVEIAIGSSTNEVQVWPPLDELGSANNYGIMLRSQSNESVSYTWPHLLPVRIPAGSRVTARYTGARNDYFGLIGFG